MLVASKVAMSRSVAWVPSDLRRQHGFLANEAVEEPIGVGDHGAGDAEAADRSDRRGVPIGEVALDRQQRLRRRQSVRNERPHGLPVDGAYSVCAGLADHGRFQEKRETRAKSASSLP